jgi:spermidine synthase
MERIKYEGMFSLVQPDDSGMSLPFIYEEDGVVTLYFRMGSVQSQMRADRPDHLVLSYTRTMMAFLLFNQYPETLVMIGLGGGSMAKWCYRHLPCSDITVVEINPQVISLRNYFYIPQNNKRFRVLCEDGAMHVARTSDQIDVLIVDGFDADGQPPELCSEEFYNACYDALTSSGLMVVNLCGWGDRINIARIKKIFGDRVLVVTPDDGSNRVVFACKGEPLWHGEHPGTFMMRVKEFEHQRNFSSASPHCSR